MKIDEEKLRRMLRKRKKILDREEDIDQMATRFGKSVLEVKRFP